MCSRYDSPPGLSHRVTSVLIVPGRKKHALIRSVVEPSKNNDASRGVKRKRDEQTDPHDNQQANSDGHGGDNASEDEGDSDYIEEEDDTEQDEEDGDGDDAELSDNSKPGYVVNPKEKTQAGEQELEAGEEEVEAGEEEDEADAADEDVQGSDASDESSDDEPGYLLPPSTGFQRCNFFSVKNKKPKTGYHRCSIKWETGQRRRTTSRRLPHSRTRCQFHWQKPDPKNGNKTE